MRLSALLIVCLLLAGCSKDPVGETKAPAPAASGAQPASGDFSLLNVYPPTTPAGKGFQVQPDGTAALAVTCTGNAMKAQIIWDGKELQTVKGEGCLFSAGVPKDLYAKPGTYQVWIRHDGVDSNKKDFVVTP
jgi:hypothetical protein